MKESENEREIETERDIERVYVKEKVCERHRCVNWNCLLVVWVCHNVFIGIVY